MIGGPDAVAAEVPVVEEDSGSVVEVDGSGGMVGPGAAVSVVDDLPTTMPRSVLVPEAQPASRASPRPTATARVDLPNTVPATRILQERTFFPH